MSEQFENHSFLFFERRNKLFRMLKFLGPGFEWLRREKILTKILKSGVIGLGCSEKLFGSLLQFSFRLSGIKVGGVQVIALRLQKIVRGLDHPLPQVDQVLIHHHYLRGEL